jgi:NAD(P)-dependent dehydrogenase (short-subunit alcohol dehydrogenase family)
MKTALITGANRGIGLALCKTYLAQGWKVIGLCRTASPELTESGARVIAGVDVSHRPCRNSPIHWTVNRLIC